MMWPFWELSPYLSDDGQKWVPFILGVLLGGPLSAKAAVNKTNNCVCAQSDWSPSLVPSPIKVLNTHKKNAIVLLAHFLLTAINLSTGLN